MSDNLNVTPGSGAIVAADEVAGVLYQRIKLAVGPADSAPADLAFGSAGAGASLPVAMSTEDIARIGATNESAAGTDTANAGLNGLIKRLLAKFTTQFPAALGGAAASASLSVTTSKDEAKVTDVTMTPDTSALSSGDVICDTQQVASCMKAVDAGGVLNSFVLIDEADQGAALTVYILGANVSMGTENAQPSITDANADTILGFFDIAVTDYRDVGGAKVACKTGLAIGLKPVSGTADVYLAIVNGTGTPTYTASSLKARLGIVS